MCVYIYDISNLMVKFCFPKTDMVTKQTVIWSNKYLGVCFLLGNSPASELPRRKHTTFRTRRKFKIKNKYHVCNAAESRR